MKGDFSKIGLADNGYSGVLFQQGRVQIDRDYNQQSAIEAERHRVALLDIIGGCCVPESAPGSFRVTASSEGVQVAAGRMWVAGIMCQSPDPVTLPLPQQPGNHLVYIEVWERVVGPIEDPDLREVALGGADTTLRTKTVVRPQIAPVGDDTCSELGDWQAPNQTTGRLIASTGNQPPDTPCVVPEAAAYTGMGNRLYRVEIHRGGGIGGSNPATFKWSGDNASVVAPLLQVDGDELVIPDAGRDDLLGFHTNQWVEISHDELDLAGQPGILVEIIGRRDSMAGFRLRFDAHGEIVPDPAQVGHPKVRRWDQGSAAASAQGAIPITAVNSPIAIEAGIQVSFSPGTYRAGDHWTVPARTFSGSSEGEILWPKDSNGPIALAPQGVVRHWCRLAVVTVSASAAPQIEDCRNFFPSLCGLDHSNGCCTVTVGRIGADVPTIAEALARLPEEGGEICVHEGIYRERVNLDNRHDISIHGCGSRTVVVAPDENPVFSLVRARNIKVSSLSIESGEGFCIRLVRASGVALDHLNMKADQAAIFGPDIARFSLSHCHIELTAASDELEAGDLTPAVFVNGRGVRLYRNRIAAVQGNKRQVMAAGGVQIAGPSKGVAFVENQIEGGLGAGVLLGSVSSAKDSTAFAGAFDDIRTRVRSGIRQPRPTGANFDRARSHFEGLERRPTISSVRPDAQGDLRVVWPAGPDLVSDGDVQEVTISGNQIRNMGGSGIRAAHFFNLTQGQGDLISIHGLQITGNLIDGCLSVPHEPVPPGMAEDSALGGITLADVRDLVIRNNTITGNGQASRTTACGIFIVHSTGLTVSNNLIRGNGPLPQSEPKTTPDRRGGIVIAHATVGNRQIIEVAAGSGGDTGTAGADAGAAGSTGSGTVIPGGGDTVTAGAGPEAATTTTVVSSWVASSGSSRVRSIRQDGTPAAVITGNVVIAAGGRALEIVGLGPMVISGNQFTALGSNFATIPSAAPVGLNLPPGLPQMLMANALGGSVVFALNLGVSSEQAGNRGGFTSGSSTSGVLPATGDSIGRRSVFAGGNIMFSGNQVQLDGQDGVKIAAFSAVSIASLGHVLVKGNQVECDLVNDQMFTDLLAYGNSLICTSNRFQETVGKASFSALTVGFMNTTSDNQGTHCFVRVGPVIPSVHHNFVLVEQIAGGSADTCAPAAGLEQMLRRELFSV